jgi:hypothetical protein
MSSSDKASIIPTMATSSKPQSSAIYQHLDHTRSEFRVLGLLGGDKDDELMGFLETVKPLDEDREVSYTAVSYCWGSDKKPCTLKLVSATQNEGGFLVDENDVLGTLPITASLDALLRSVRGEPLIVRRFWIDQLCINQDDNTEKTHQVRQMSIMYQAARETVIWLGKATSDTELAFQAARELAAMKDWKDDDIPNRFESLTNSLERLSIWPEKPPEQEPLDPEIQKALDSHPWIRRDAPLIAWKTFASEILQQDWFTRTWVIQELCVSQSPLICKGDYVLDWDTIWHACDVSVRGEMHPGDAFRGAAVKHAHNLGALRRNAQELHFLEYSEVEEGDTTDHKNGESSESHALRKEREQRIEYLRQELSLESLLPKTRRAHATDPRDKVFAVLNISTTGELDIIDYDKSLAGVGLDAALSWTRPVELLDHVDLCASANKEMGLPCWIPNWYQAQLSMAPLLDVGEACAGLGVEPPGFYPGVIARQDKYVALGVMGIKVATVAAAGPVKTPGATEDVPEGRNHAEMVNQFADPYPTTDKSYIDCYKCVIEPCAEDYKCSKTTRLGTVWEHKEKIASNPEALKPSVTGRYTEKQLIDSLPIQYRKNIFYIRDRPATNRLFFVTKEGFMGLGSQGIASGDVVCAILGGRLLYIVRPLGEGTGLYQFMGNCYIYGLMNGEVFHGHQEDRVERFILA